MVERHTQVSQERDGLKDSSSKVKGVGNKRSKIEKKGSDHTKNIENLWSTLKVTSSINKISNVFMHTMNDVLEFITINEEKINDKTFFKDLMNHDKIKEIMMTHDDKMSNIELYDPSNFTTSLLLFLLSPLRTKLSPIFTEKNTLWNIDNTLSILKDFIRNEVDYYTVDLFKNTSYKYSAIEGFFYKILLNYFNEQDKQLPKKKEEEHTPISYAIDFLHNILSHSKFYNTIYFLLFKPVKYLIKGSNYSIVYWLLIKPMQTLFQDIDKLGSFISFLHNLYEGDIEKVKTSYEHIEPIIDYAICSFISYENRWMKNNHQNGKAVDFNDRKNLQTSEHLYIKDILLSKLPFFICIATATFSSQFLQSNDKYDIQTTFKVALKVYEEWLDSVAIDKIKSFIKDEIIDGILLKLSSLKEPSMTYELMNRFNAHSKSTIKLTGPTKNIIDIMIKRCYDFMLEYKDARPVNQLSYVEEQLTLTAKEEELFFKRPEKHIVNTYHFIIKHIFDKSAIDEIIVPILKWFSGLENNDVHQSDQTSNLKNNFLSSMASIKPMIMNEKFMQDLEGQIEKFVCEFSDLIHDTDNLIKAKIPNIEDKQLESVTIYLMQLSYILHYLYGDKSNENVLRETIFGNLFKFFDDVKDKSWTIYSHTDTYKDLDKPSSWLTIMLDFISIIKIFQNTIDLETQKQFISSIISIPFFYFTLMNRLWDNPYLYEINLIIFQAFINYYNKLNENLNELEYHKRQSIARDQIAKFIIPWISDEITYISAANNVMNFLNQPIKEHIYKNYKGTFIEGFFNLITMFKDDLLKQLLDKPLAEYIFEEDKILIDHKNINTILKLLLGLFTRYEDVKYMKAIHTAFIQDNKNANSRNIGIIISKHLYYLENLPWGQRRVVESSDAHLLSKGEVLNLTTEANKVPLKELIILSDEYRCIFLHACLNKCKLHNNVDYKYVSDHLKHYQKQNIYDKTHPDIKIIESKMEDINLWILKEHLSDSYIKQESNRSNKQDKKESVSSLNSFIKKLILLHPNYKKMGDIEITIRDES